MLTSSSKGFGSGIVKVIKLEELDISVLEEYTQEVTYFSEYDPIIIGMQKQRRNTYRANQRNELRDEDGDI